MKIIIDMGHPAHVHLFKNFIWEMERRGHSIKVTARDKEVTRQLLDAYHIPYDPVGKPLTGIFPLFREWAQRTYLITKMGKQFNADIYIGVLNPATAISAWINRKKSFTLTDTEHAKFAKKMTFPFSSHILTPSCYNGEIGAKQIRYNGYHELAYLHPNWFTPNPTVLTELGLTEDTPFCIVRFVSWGASHDVGQRGIQDKIHLVSSLKKFGRVLITSEDALPLELECYKIQISPEKLHDLLYYAAIYIGEGATTASECAVLGTHALYINTLRLGYINEENEKYDLVYNFSRTEEIQTGVLHKAKELLNDPELRVKGRQKRVQLLKDKIDVTAFMVWFIENYPQSFFEMKEHHGVQYFRTTEPVK